MAKEEIKKLLDDSKTSLDQEFSNSEQNVKDELKSFKKKTLDRI